MKITTIICGAIPKELLIITEEEEIISRTSPRATKCPTTSLNKKADKSIKSVKNVKKKTKNSKKSLTKKK